MIHGLCGEVLSCFHCFTCVNHSESSQHTLELLITSSHLTLAEDLLQSRIIWTGLNYFCILHIDNACKNWYWCIYFAGNVSAIVEYMCTAQATDHHHLIVETFQGWSALILSSLTITTHHLHHLQSSLHQHLVNKDLENQSSTQREEKQSISFCIYPEAQSIISEWQFENILAKTDEN